MGLLKIKINTIVQNLVLGSITGIIVAYNLRMYFMRVGGAERFWFIFLLIGPLLGLLSGLERQRYERLKKEKMALQEDMAEIQNRLKKTATKYRLLIENATDAIFLTTADGKFVLFNEATSVITGYKKHELQSMSVHQLQADKDVQAQSKGWLDNRVCRYEDKWQSKNGKTVYVDVNSKWIQLGSTRLILYIVRDVAHSREAGNDERNRRLQIYQEQKTSEIAMLQNNLLNWILQQSRILFTAADEVKTSKSEEIKQQLEKFQVLLEQMKRKYCRDLDAKVRPWNLNEVLAEELHYLDLTSDVKGANKQLTFASELPPIMAVGKDLSIVFNILFRAALESVSGTQKRELFLTTKTADSHVLIEMMLPQGRGFKDALCNVLDPSYLPGDGSDHDLMNERLAAYHMLFESFRGKVDFGKDESSGVYVRVRIPKKDSKGGSRRPAEDEMSKSVVL